MKNRDKIHELLYLLFSIAIVIALPFSQKACSLSIILLAFNWLLEGKFRQKLAIAKSSMFILLIVLFAALHFLSLLYSDLQQGLFSIEVKLALFILPIVIGTMPKFSSKKVFLILSFFVLSCTAATLWSISKSVAGESTSTSIYRNFDSVTAENFKTEFKNESDKWQQFSYLGLSKNIKIDPSYFGMYLLFSVSLLGLFIMDRFGQLEPIYKVLSALLILLLVTTIIFLSSRIVIIGLVILLLTYIVTRAINLKNYVQGAFICVFFLIFLSILIYQNPITRFRLITEPLKIENNFSANPEWNSVSLRVLQWKASINVIISSPIIGVGLGDVKNALNSQYKQIADLREFDKGYNAHNQYLQTTASLGLVGLLTFLAILFYPAWKAFQKRDFLTLSFLFIVSICFLTESMLLRQKGVAFFSFFLPLLFFHPLTTSSPKADE